MIKFNITGNTLNKRNLESKSEQKHHSGWSAHQNGQFERIFSLERSKTESGSIILVQKPYICCFEDRILP